MNLEPKIEMFGNPSSEFSISEKEFRDVLSTDADRNEEYWHFQESGLEVFVEKLTRLFVVSNGGFTFQVNWPSDKPLKIENLSFSEFIETVKSNRMGKKTKYVVVGSV